MHPKALFLALAVLGLSLFSLTACSDDTSSPPVLSLSLISGGNQTGTVGEALAQPIIVQVTDDRGRAVSGEMVSFAVTGGGGSVTPSSGAASGTGLVEAHWTLGNGAGEEQTLQATLVSNGATVSVSAGAAADQAAAVTAEGGNQQNGLLGGDLSDPLTVFAEDRFGNPVPGVQVTWSVISGGGQLSSTSSQTDADGHASTTWTLGQTDGTQVAMASAGNLQTVFVAFASPFDLTESVVVIDSTQVELASDSTQRANGELRFESAGGVLPEIEVGEIVVGTEDGGFLRRVDAVQISGSQLILTTSPASMDEIMEEGSFETTVQMSQAAVQGTGPESVDWGPTRVAYLAEGASREPDRVSLSGMDLCEELVQGACPAGLSLTIPSGQIIFDPDVDIGADFSGISLEEFHAIATGVLGLDLDLQLQASVDFSTGAEKKIFEFRKPFVVSMVAGEVRLKGFLGFSASGGATGTITTGFGGSNTTQVGARYENEEWTGIFQNTLNFSPLTTDWSARASASARVYMRPEVEVILYTVAGPRIGLEPYLSAAGEIDIPSWQLDVFGGIDASLGFKVEILSQTLADYNRTFEGPTWQIYSASGNLNGDLQVNVVTTGEDLDPDGYSVVVDGGTQQTVSTNGSVSFNDLVLGTHTVQLTGVAGNCTVTAPNPRSVNVPVAGTQTTFSVSCEGMPSAGTLAVNTTTTGDDLDPDGYSVTVGGFPARSIGINDSEIFSSLTPAVYTVTLSGVAPNCTVSGGNYRSVSVQAGQTATAQFTVTCTASSGSGLSGIIFYQKGGDIYRMELSTGTESLVYGTSAYDGWPVVSPDGTKIAFSSAANSSRARVWMMNSDGSNPVEYASSLDMAEPTDWIGDQILIRAYEPYGSGGSVWWATTSSLQNPTMVYYQSGQDTYTARGWESANTILATRATRYSGAGGAIIRIAADGSGATAVWSSSTAYNVNAVSLSNGGGQAVFQYATSSGGLPDLYLFDMTSQTATKLVTNGQFGVWSPDDQSILFRRNGNLWVTDLSGNAQQITTDGVFRAVTSWVTSVASPTPGATAGSGSF